MNEFRQVEKYVFQLVASLAITAFVMSVKDGYAQGSMEVMRFTETQLTNSPSGHTIHNTQVFSHDDQWIVFDARNDDSKIGETGRIGMVNTKTKAISILYSTKHQTVYGPGVGAATFSPKQDTVLFIHGIRNADQTRPYSFTRRTGVAIDIRRPDIPMFMDGRDIDAPYTPGALRGGTHAHSWSGDGRWISFTYNDHVIEQLSKKNPAIHDLRTVGVMIPKPVQVLHPADSAEDFGGRMFAVTIAKVVDNPRPESDEIDRAYDETWIGRDGYINKMGIRQKRAIAFQGDVKDRKGVTKTEVFVVDLPEDITRPQPGKPLAGTETTRPNVPSGIRQRRVTYTENGIQGPRFWLRTTSDGSRIFFLAKDAEGIVQINAVPTNGGEPIQITHNGFSVEGPFNVSPDDNYIAYMGDHSVFLTNLKNGTTFRISERVSEKGKPVGAPVWSNDGSEIAYNRYADDHGQWFLQIFLLKKQ